MKRFLVLSLIVFSSLLVNAQNGKYQSAFIYQFTNFIEWPANKKSGDFVIGVVGSSDVSSFLEVLAQSRTVGAQKIVVKKLNSADEASNCHIIFLSDNKSSEFDEALNKAKSSNALLITEKDGLGRKGSGINFIMKDGKLNFELNKSSMSKSGLKISSKLEALGVVVG